MNILKQTAEGGIRTFRNAGLFKDAENIPAENFTQPDQALSPKEILVRFAKNGGHLDGPQFDEDDSPDFSKTDLEEAYIMYHEANQKQKDAERKLSKITAASHKEEIRQEVERKLRSEKQPDGSPSGDTGTITP